MTLLPHSKERPFFASLKERFLLSKEESKKKTRHLVLDLKDSALSYEPGDALGIFPQHDPELVDKTLKALRATGKEMISLNSSGEQVSLAHYLTAKANITDVSPQLFRAVATRQTNHRKSDELKGWAEEGNRDGLKAYLEKHEVWDFLLAHHEVSFTPQECINLLLPLFPRFYSIASSQKLVKDEVHLMVAPVEYESNGHCRRGVCAHYLCELVDLNTPTVATFVQRSHGFSPPLDPHASMIMIGPGTGVAPFRAFLQQRLLFHESQGNHWLFFGEWNRKSDFFYEEDWERLRKKGHLRLTLAFSRDQEEKIYVQHRMWEQGEELYQWLEKGAYLYVCGDARWMAKDVEAMLHRIVEEFGRKEKEDAREYIKALRREKRYLRDVY